ncbi:MAG: phage late control D family protein [Vicinamibacterales bacterium]
MDTQSILIDALTDTNFYAPDFLIEIEGQTLDPASKGDVLELKVVMDMDNLTSFELSINNWDDQKFTFKYSDTTVFDIGNRLHVQLGYAGRLRSMVRGIITALTPRFAESGPPTIGVSGLDAMMLLRDRKPKDGELRKYVKMTDWEIAQQIATRNKLKINDKQECAKHDLVVQKNQDDAQFLMERARRIDFDCFVRTDPDTHDATLNFVKPTDARDSSTVRVYVFEWGKSLINFTPQLTVSRQVSQVTVRGWDPRQKKPISYTATASDLPPGAGGGDTGPEVAQQKLQDKQDTVVDAPVTNDQEARDLAISLLRERAYQFLTGSGQVIGLPDLRPGDNVDLRGLGKRFSGRYYVKKVEHSLGSSGYHTSFDVRRQADGGTQ